MTILRARGKLPLFSKRNSFMGADRSEVPRGTLANLVRRCRGLFRSGREVADIKEELRFHLEMETGKNLQAGMDPREARRRAHVRLGGIGAIREAVRDARGGRPLEDLLRDLGYALRGVRRNPGFTLAAAVSLAIPIGFNTTVFSIVDSLLYRALVGLSPRATRRRLHERPRRRAVLDYLVSGLPQSARGERRVHGHGGALFHGRCGACGRGRRPGAGRDGDRQLLSASRPSAAARPAAGAGGRSTGRPSRSRDLRPALGTSPLPGIRGSWARDSAFGLSRISWWASRRPDSPACCRYSMRTCGLP